jgi:hypothetical protein
MCALADIVSLFIRRAIIFFVESAVPQIISIRMLFADIADATNVIKQGIFRV